MDFGKGYIIREKIPAFAVNKYEKEYEGEKQTSTFLNIGISRLREVDDKGNTHTIWCQEYDPEQNKSVGDKVYIGRMKEIETKFKDKQPQDTQVAQAVTKALDNDLPF